METEKVLFVDDEPNLLAAIQRQLRNRVNLQVASSGSAALEILKNDGPFAVIVSDMRMPEMDGVELLHRVSSVSPDTVKVMLTGNTDQDTAIRAVNEGNIFRFLNKPCAPPALMKAIDDAKEQYRLVTAEKQLLQRTLAGSVRLLTDILAIVNPSAFGTGSQLRERASELTAHLEMENKWELDIAAMLCQIGSVALPDDLLERQNKSVPLSAEELRMLKEMPATSHRLLKNIPRLEGVANIVLYHTKNYDGHGFPADEVRQEQIPVGARVLKIALDLQKLIDKGLAKDAALKELLKQPDRYDSSILEKALKEFVPAPELLNGEAAKPTVVGPEELLPGQRILMDVETVSGLLLVKSGTLLTDAIVERIKNFKRLVGIREPLSVDVRIPTHN